jgi:AcrR family transcriptional regulator
MGKERRENSRCRGIQPLAAGSKQMKRSEETKNSIITAAQKLFAEQGYDTVTMREIAKEAGCSHTTIYIYFKDKVALLNQLAMPSLLELKLLMEEAVKQK